MATGRIRVELEGKGLETAAGTSVLQLMQQVDPQFLGGDDPVLLASVNGRRVSLAETLTGDERVRLVRASHPLARTTIQRTVIFLLAAAAEDLFPGHELWVNFSYGGGVYVELKRDEPLTVAEIAALEQRMREIRDEDLALLPQRLGMRAVLKIYERRGERRSYKAARYLRRDSMTVYRMQGRDQLFYGRQLPSTGKVGNFRLQPEDPGFVLLIDTKGGGPGLPAFKPQPKLLKTLRDYSRWADNLEMADTGSLNEWIVKGRTSELIQVSEARHAHFFVNAARHVGDMPEHGRLVLLAGPSSSGKTSSAKRLMVQLRVLGFKPFALSLDDYFVDREDTPRGPDGDYDYEALGALKIDLFNEHLQALMAGEAVHLPKFDFVSGRGTPAKEPTRLQRGQPLIVEGIHALNPAMTPRIPAEDKILIYVSALCHMNITNLSFIRTSHTRLFRRIVRDAQFRGYTASETLARWPKVRHGEDTHIFPFQNNADLFFNSGLTYEMAVLKLWAEPRLAAVDADDPNYGLARTLIDILALLLPIDASQVPPTSLLREFIGGSGFSY
ncbi:MAG TPA: nucleoside kinase [Candidatus Krumholzibacteria bacterium]|nr:nucleoside kinase [Candidatus Krumholzibacteria bacterium]